MIPGSNLLNMALGIIGSQPVRYYRDSKQRQELPNGILVTQFEPGVIISSGSVQAVSPTHIEQAGLDVSRRHIEWFVSLDVLGVERDASGDEIEWDSKRWKAITPEKWVVQDGWCAVICQEV
ncbi:hypothetical protein FHU10_5156 [Serratia fonticola]|jgi:hypothetical protein|uniref:Uncharacterized protein n=1 Tax=Serratia fonticola TaxID=47917 RepID=A0A542BN21_SERFO|nr:hypothetical protein [Serratia fonticola]TQI79993.1 hypothetical protein FHU09_2548 [Serratia fonticola]TQI97981.1 hypothetical protein FHU11_3498 [Serratia fonticola]TVZ72476.1 hypothetical protein FHU10_5156 [Serratia fonticola]